MASLLISDISSPLHLFISVKLTGLVTDSIAQTFMGQRIGMGSKREVQVSFDQEMSV
jgi:hypothetical protein